MNLEIIVYGSPIAQPRARSRAFMVKGKIHVRAYEPETSKDKNTGIRKVNPIYEWKQAVRKACYDALGITENEHYEGRRPPLWEGPIKMDLTLYFPRPKEYDKKQYPDGPIRHIKKPDRDNMEKAILDSMKGIIFVDDCQVCDGTVRKYYHGRTQRPHALIQIAQIHETY